MLRYFLLICFALVNFQGIILGFAQVESTDSSITNEADYKFVFDQMETQIENAPNKIINPELDKYLLELSCELSEQYCQEIRIYVIDEPAFNAHMFPNGALIIYSGLLLRIENKAQLAYIISHEMAHYVYKHGIKKINHNKLANSSVNQTSGLNPFKGITRFNSSASINQYSQQLEHDADLFSIKLLSKNNLPLIEVAFMFENLRQENTVGEKVNKGGFSSSHPGTKQRIKLFQQHAIKTPARTLHNNDSWSILKAKFIGKWLESELSKREFKSTRVLLNHLKANSNNPSYYDFYFGEIYRKQGGRKNAETAISYYEKYLKNNTIKLISKVYKNLGDCYVELNKSDQALFYYNKYINLSPQPTDIHIIRNEITRF